MKENFDNIEFPEEDNFGVEGDVIGRLSETDLMNDPDYREVVEMEEIFDEMDKFINNKDSKEYRKEWIDNFRNNPAEFSNEENIEKLKEMPMHKRISMLAHTSRFLTYTPNLAKKYFEEFSKDFKVIEQWFKYCDGMPESVMDSNLFALNGIKLKESCPKTSRGIFSDMLDNYAEIAERRNYAPNNLLKNFEYNYGDSFKEFGKAAEGFLKSLDEADKLLSITGDFNYIINPEHIFTPEYEQMDEGKKANFLRKAIAELQFNLVNEEVYNTKFTKERTDRSRQMTIEGIKEGERPRYDESHSMLFKTYQPVSIYQKKQDYFDKRMDGCVDIGGNVEEYPYHRLLLAVLDRIKDIEVDKDSNTDVLVDFWNKNRNPIFGNLVVEALIKQNIDRAAGGLLELLGKEKTDKNPLTAILYRLEFGRIGISQEGVKYLGKMYDLGELNNPDYFAQRLTAKGDIGIFDDKKVLQKFFNLGDLADDKKVIEPKIHDFVYRTLFLEKEGETEEEKQKREQYLKEFKENYFNFYDDKFFEKTGIRFNNLDFKEQGWFLIYHKNAESDKKEKLLEFAGKYGENGLKTFLSLEHGEEMGDKILDIAQNLDFMSANLIFNKYAEIVDLAGRVKGELGESLKKDQEISQDDIEAISRDLVGRANKLLVDFSDKIKVTKDKGDIMAKLENYQLDLVLTASVYKSLKQSGVELKDFKGVTFEGKTADKIDAEELRQMLKIYGDNYGGKYGYSDKFKNVLVNNLEQKIKNSVNRIKVYMCKKKCENGGDRIMVFNAFEDRGNGKKHGFAYNTIESMSGSSIGKCFLRTSLEMITAFGETVEAECDPRSPMSSYYIENEGFVCKGATDNYQDTGEPALIIEKSVANQKFEYRKYSREEIIAEQGNYAEGAKKMVLKFQIDTPDLLNNFLREANEIMNEGYTMTRYIFNGKKGPVYCAFEKS